MHTDEEVEATVANIRGSNNPVAISQEFIHSRDAHWAERDAALNRLGELIQEGSLDPNADDFSPVLKTIILGLVTQLPDLRSQVVRSACGTLALLAAEVGDHSALDRPMREQVIPAVIALISNGNKVLASAGRECLPTLVMYGHFEGSIKVLTQALAEARHVAVRHSCCVCLLHVLQYWPMQTLSAVAMVLERSLLPACTDAAVEVRALARQCLVHYVLAFPDRQPSVEGNLDEQTRKLVKQEISEARDGPPPERHVDDGQPD